MKKLLLIVGVLSLLSVLAACGGTEEGVITPPSFVGVSVDGTNPHDGTDYETYYKEKNQSTMIEIVLNNPDSLEIRAIVINGYSYRYTRFTEDSTHNVVYFDLDPGEVLGLTEYTVDDIEYFDGADTKDVLVNSNNEFHIYVFKELPVVERENYELGQESISVDFNIFDEDEVIQSGSLQVLLYEGSVVKETIDISTGFASLEFQNLKSDTYHEVKVIANYDIDDTTGIKTEVVLFNGSFTTLPTALPSALLSEVEVSSNSVTFNVTYNDNDLVTTVSGLKVRVYDGNTVIRESILPGSYEQITFSDLLNSKEYTLKLVADYDLRDGEGVKTEYILASQSFTTSSREVPVPQIDNVVIEENRILFDITIVDDELEPIIDMSTLVAKVYVAGVLERIVEIRNEHVELQVYDVLSGKEIYIELVATYDLNDGNGAIPDQVIGVIEYESLLNSSPVAIVNDIVITQGYINLDLLVTDVSQTLKAGTLRAVLYENDGEVPVQTILLDIESFEAQFNYLIQYTNNYRIEILADYNLLDGKGLLEDQVLYTHVLTSMVPKAPAAEVQNLNTNSSGFTFDILVMDADLTVEANSVYVFVYKDGILLDTFTTELIIGINDITVNGLLSDNAYEIVIVADYNILDGSGIQTEQVLLTQEIVTKAKEIPTAGEIVSNDNDITNDSILFNINIIDNDNVIETGSLRAILLYNNIPTGDFVLLNVGDNFGVQFLNVDSNTTYKVEIVVSYDLDNGEGIIPDFPLGEFTATTDPKAEPTVDGFNIFEGDKEGFSFNIEIVDPDNTITGNIFAQLWIGDTLTSFVLPLEVGPNFETFTGIYSNQNYNIRIIADYDLNDNINVFTGKTLDDDFATTAANEMVRGDIHTVTVGIDTLTFSAVVTDNDSVITDNLLALLFLEGELLPVDSMPVVVGENTNLQFTGLISDSEYTVQIVTDYSLRDIEGEYTDELLASYSTSTYAYSAPEGYVTNVSITIDSIMFDTVITDNSNTSTGDYKAELFYLGVTTGQFEILNEGLTQEIEFTGLFSGADYEVRILSTYDLHDLAGELTDEMIYSTLIETIARKAPVGNASSVLIDENNVHFLFSYFDEDLTLIPNTFKAWLYDENDNLISVKSLYAEEVLFDISYLIADYTFTVKITGDYDLSNGTLFVDDGILLSMEFTTEANAIPEVIISDVVINQATVDAIINVSDIDEVSQGDLRAQLFDSNHLLIDEIILTIGVNNIEFNAILNYQELYNIIIVGDYDLRDAEGFVDDAILAENSILAFNKVVPQAHAFNFITTTSSIQVDILILDNYSTYVDNAKVILYKDGTPIETQVLSIGLNDDVLFSGLVSNADYYIEIFVDYNNDDGNGLIVDFELAIEPVHVDAKLVPTAVVSNPIIISDEITVDITVVDTDGVITGNLKAVLYKDGLATLFESPLVVPSNLAVNFAGLNSNSTYEVRVVADYDLTNDLTVVAGGTIGSDSFITLANVAPTASISNLAILANQITFDSIVTDDDSVIQGDINVKVYLDGIYTGTTFTISGGTSNGIVIGSLLSDSNYTWEIVVNYDLHDGAGLVTEAVLTNASAQTLVNGAPSGILGNTIPGFETLTFDAIVIDTDGVITGNLLAVLYDDGIPTGATLPLVVGDNLGEQFTGLFSNRIYEIRIETDYDLLDGNGIEVSFDLDATSDVTSAKATPNAVISNQTSTNTSLKFDVLVVDSASAIVGNAYAVLYLDGVATGASNILVVGSNLDVEFTGLDYGEEYVVKIETDYNNNIGDPDVVDFVLSEEVQQTDALVSIENIVVDALSVNFDLLLNDQFSILDDSYLTLRLFDESETEVGVYVLNGTGSVDILNYYNDHTYRLEVEANVTVGGVPVVVFETTLVVPERLLQAISIGSIGVNATQINTNISVVLPDPDAVIDGATLEAVLYELQGGVYVEIDAVTLIDGDNAVVFSGIDGTDGTEYMIVVHATCDFNDGLGAQVEYVIDARTFIWTTQA